MCRFQFLLAKATDLHAQKIPFVLYRKPCAKEVYLGYASEKKNTKNPAAPFFVFAPFENPFQNIQIPLETTIKVSFEFEKDAHIPLQKIDIKTTLLEKQTHLDLVAKTIDFIKAGGSKKVVIASAKKVAVTKTFEQVFHRFLQLYESGFAYVFFHPTTGIWMGTTPELLARIKNEMMHTVALAGTRVRKTPSTIWQKKEVEEQAMVVEGITASLQKIGLSPKVGICETVKAGHLEHLSTSVKAPIKGKKIFEMIETLHPTPAICGLPLQKAKAFILKNEGFDRKFYTGFLGVVDPFKNTANIFVNLRCLHLENNSATIYAGGGITEKSIPEKEWEEIQLKRQTMMRCIFDQCLMNKKLFLLLFFVFQCLIPKIP